MVRITPNIDEKTKTTEASGLGIDVGRLKYHRLFRAPERRRKQRHLRVELVVSWVVFDGPYNPEELTDWTLWADKVIVF